MTDCIIQPILLKYRINIQWAYSPEEIEYYFNLMQQELIEKIKQEVEFGCIHSCGVCKYCHCLSIRLIGDNKE